jgi:hypothetical protein
MLGVIRVLPPKSSGEAATAAGGAMNRGRQVTIDIRFIQEIEEALSMDCAPPPSVIAPLAVRAGLRLPPWRPVPFDEHLEEDSLKARQESGTWLELEEIDAVQRLRGWHRNRYGNVTVDAGRLEDVRYALGGLREALNDECDQTAEEYGISRVGLESSDDSARREWRDFRWIRSQVIASMSADETCGECHWCWIRRLHIECCRLLEAATAAEEAARS